jgi:hypothetical protein
MKIFSITIVLGIAALLPECVQDSGQTITEGIYREPSKVEALTVKGREVTLQLKATKGPNLGMVDGTYRYEVLTHGKLRFGASSNDPFFVFTILDYDWSWDSKDIVRKHKGTGETVVFTRE